MSVDDNHLSREKRRLTKHNHDNWHILIVDDNADNLSIAKVALEFQGIDVRTAVDGISGLEILKTYDEVSLILLDLSMPKMDGWEMFEAIRQNPKYAAIPVIALTAHVMDADVQRIQAAGFTGYIGKPFSIMTLVPEIKQILEKTDNEDE